MCLYKIKYKPLLFTVLLLLSVIDISARNPITFIITDIPDYTPEKDSVFLVTSFDNWINDPQKKFKYYPDGLYRLTIDIGDIKTFEYKINRGNWNKGEGNSIGEYRENRRFTFNDTIFEVKLKIESWEDLHDLAYPSVKVIVRSIPKNTPRDASIYISGNFNNWTVDDPSTKLTKRASGEYGGVIPAGFRNLSYKFTRGSWASVECRRDGGMCSNRIFKADQADEKQIVANIASWDDLSKGNIWIKLIFLTFFLQSFVLTAILINYNESKVLILLCGLFTIVFIARFLYADHNLFHIFPYVYFLPAVAYVFIAPLLYMWFKYKITANTTKVSYIYILPLLPVIWFLQYLRLSEHEFYLKVVNNELNTFIFSCYAYAIVLGVFFNYKLKKIIRRNIAAIPNPTYGLYRAMLFNCYFSIFIFIIIGIAMLQNVDSKFVVDWLDNILWISVGIILIYYEYFFFSGIYSKYAHRYGNREDEILSKNTWITLKDKLTDLMETKAVYTNPNLTLSDIAGRIGTNKHYVSKLINEGFRKSYTDYINEYRIKAFVNAVENDKNNNTFLFHAFEVGFNSKSSFNRAFKKVTNKTPSEYFTNLR
ncbi:MAG: helix-turn-helix transcriptional regulator [Bacteroidales bacterium]|nr:helix-turn-helix transcriptional regulator [Bacteroidales bacterium]